MNSETSMFIFLENIRRLRKREQLSPQDMAKKLGVGVNTLARMEGGTIPDHVSCRIVDKIQKEFQIEPCLLFSELVSLEK